MSDSKEIELYLSQIYPEAKSSRDIQVSYVKTITGEDKIIFIYQENESQKYNYVDSPTYINDSRQINLDLTGSPLEDTCEIETLNTDLEVNLKLKRNTQWKLKEQNFIPIELNKARKIINYISMKPLNRDNIKQSIWILCNGLNNHQNTVLLQLKFSSSFNCRGLINYHGIISVNDLNMSEMMKSHMNKIEKAGINTTVECIFYVSPYSHLNVVWNTSSLNAPLNNFKNSDITLFQSIETGKPSLISEEIWMQLMILNKLKNDILNFNFGEEKYECLDCGEKYMDLETICKKIILLLTDASELQENEINITDCDLGAVINNVAKRSDLDLTDQLWDLLKYCSCYHDLKSALNYVFSSSSKCNIVNMPTNENCLAEIIREVSQHRLAIPCLTGTEPLELLLEIGLEKAFKDYEYIFSTSKMCIPSQLKSSNITSQNSKLTDNSEKSTRKSLFVKNNVDGREITPPQRKTLYQNPKNNLEKIEGFKNSKFDESNVDNKLSRLAQIHLVLEHLILIQNHLNLDNLCSTICEQLLKKSPKPYQIVFRNSIDEIQIPLTVDDVFNLLNQKIPQTRKITMDSKNNFKEIQTVFYFSEDDIIPPKNLSETNLSKEYTKKNIYHYWEYTNIKTKK